MSLLVHAERVRQNTRDREAIDVSFIEVVKSLRPLNAPPKHALCFGHGYEAYSNGFEGLPASGSRQNCDPGARFVFSGARGNCGLISLLYGLFIQPVQEVIR